MSPYSPSDVSVIIPAFCAEHHVARAVESVLAQTVRPGEVIVVVDGEYDGTADVVRDIARRPGGQSLRMIVQAHSGAGSARNRGIREAKGSVIAFLDADDEWLPTKLAESLEHLSGNVLVAHNYIRVRASHPSVVVDCVRHFARADDPYVALYLRGYLATSTVITLRDNIIAAGGFDPDLANAQDFDLWLRLLAPSGAKFTVFAAALTRYHFGESGLTGNTDRRLRCCRQVALLHAPSLRGRTKSPLITILLRMLAIHYEAVTAHLRNRRVLRAFATLSGLVLGAGAAVRATLSPGTRKHRWISVLLYTWVFLAVALYVAQFLGPIATIVDSLI